MLKEDIEQVLNNYKRARNENFTGHPMAKVLRINFPNDLKEIIDEPNKYKITGSAGQGNWTYSPWVAIFDKRITTSAQSGFYPVYLFKEDMSGVYLSLNQGATDLKNKYGNRRANEILNTKSKNFRDKLNGLIQVSDNFLESIDLEVENSPNAPFYEAGNIYAKYYSLNNLPSEEKLESDLKEVLNMYDLLVSEDEPLKIIENESEIAESQKKFVEIFKNATDKIVSGKAGFQGGQEEGNFYWSNKLGIWLCSRKIETSRYWNGFGVEEPEEDSGHTIICEINFPLRGIRRSVAGAFAKDESENIYVIHRGKLGGNFSKVFFEENYEGEWTSVQDGDRKTDVVVIGRLDDPVLPEKVRDFVLMIDRMKNGPKIEETPSNEDNELEKLPSASFYEFLVESGYFFDPKIVENFLLSLKVKPFVILTGNSGTGKTKLAQLFARYQLSNYNIVPVGANWTENRHLLGFYNIITKNYQETTALTLITEASKNSQIPHFLILDEMNLSHVERYFADFLSSMESQEAIPLHSNEDNNVPNELKIPGNLLVVGTVNVDETTYMFSPKVLDRANTIEFSTSPAKSYMLNDYGEYQLTGNSEYLEDPLSNLEIRDCKLSQLKEELEDVKIEGGDYLWDVLADEVNNFQEVLGKAGFDFGFRVIDEILRFMYVAWIYEGRPEIWDNWMRYFDAQIKQKMLPKLHGSQRVLENVLMELFELCYTEAVEPSPRYFGDLKSDKNVKYLSSALKIQEMDKVLYEQRYVSFIN
ncbi:MrcB family domain-containing protein [Methanobacterium congolense]|uniref:ATPase associated with various cellular activities AAA_5 n=1 Tax=Methanobacterium congolense TaxID=118062 RepID=A0A1D3L1E1_9EURY|nr:DUF3578 domain-containing protein [Methanobacterium congolense]SCG85417.1 ATPase associated with various cellular activities AAA_5 [Methanobacterium congolense]